MFSEYFSRQQLMQFLKWLLYFMLFFFAMLLQSIVLPRLSIAGITLCILPICLSCISSREGADHGTLFGLIAGTFFCLSGADCGPLYLFVFTLSCAMCGAICDQFYTRTIAPTLLLSLLSLTLCEGLVFLFRAYTGAASISLWFSVLIPEILLSAILFPVFYPTVLLISKLGR